MQKKVCWLGLVSVLLLILFLIVEAIWTEEVRSLFYGYLLPSCDLSFSYTYYLGRVSVLLVILLRDLRRPSDLDPGEFF